MQLKPFIQSHQQVKNVYIFLVKRYLKEANKLSVYTYLALNYCKFES